MRMSDVIDLEIGFFTFLRGKGWSTEIIRVGTTWITFHGDDHLYTIEELKEDYPKAEISPLILKENK